jgi:glucose/arabinose dehydrogenase
MLARKTRGKPRIERTAGRGIIETAGAPRSRLLLLAAVTFLTLAFWSTSIGEEDSAAAANGPLPVFSSVEFLPAPSFITNLAFAPDGRLFFNERCASPAPQCCNMSGAQFSFGTGKVRIVMPDGQLLATSFAEIPNVACKGDYGLVGLEFDPDYATNHYVYIGYMKLITSSPYVAQGTVVRYTDVNNVGTDPTVIVGDLPFTDPVLNNLQYHGLNNIHFGPDGKLYISLGEDNQKMKSQDVASPLGKLMRVNKEDGTAAAGNPFENTPGADPRVYAYGFRNSFDFTWRADNGSLYMTENGFSTCDELNLIVPGGNYEWPLAFDENNQPLGPTCNAGVGIPAMPETIPDPDPVQTTYHFRFFEFMDGWSGNSTSAPTGILAIDGDQFPSLGDSLMVCEYRVPNLRLLQLGGPNLDTVVGEPRVLSGQGTDLACRVDVALSPTTGDIFFTNSTSIRRLLIDSDADTPGGCQPTACSLEDKLDNCPYVANAEQANVDGDAFGDACDTGDFDGDLFADDIEYGCGSASDNVALVPERTDTAADDDGDGSFNEALPATALSFDCDRDGYLGMSESGTPYCLNAINDDAFDGNQAGPDISVNDGCPAYGVAESGGSCGTDTFDNDYDLKVNDGCTLFANVSEASFKIGTSDQDPCGNNGWPANLYDNTNPPATVNELTIQDVLSFVSPDRRLDTSPGDALFSARYDLVPGKGILSKHINIQDILALLGGTTGAPPMFNGTRAFNLTCPYPP